MQWLLYELLWRDFFRFITKKYAMTGAAAQTTPAAGAAAASMALA
jgi:deoxyribodipyrimidine photolyase